MNTFFKIISEVIIKIKSILNYAVSIFPLNSIVQSATFGRRLLMEAYNYCLDFYNENKLYVWFFFILISVLSSNYRLIYFLIILEVKKLVKTVFESKSETYLNDERTIAKHCSNDWDLKLLNVVISVFSIFGLFIFLLMFLFELDIESFFIFLHFNPAIGLYILLSSFIIEFFGTCHIIFYRNDPIKEGGIPMVASAGWKLGKSAALAILGFFGGISFSQNEAVTDGIKKINSNIPSIGTELVHRHVHGVEHTNTSDHELYMSIRKSYPNLKIQEITTNKQFDFEKIEKKFVEDEDFSSKLVISDYHKMGLGKYLNHKAVEQWNANKIAQFGEEGAKARNYIVTVPNKKS